MSYVGKWSVEEPEVAKGIDGDEGLVMSKSQRTIMTGWSSSGVLWLYRVKGCSPRHLGRVPRAH